MDETSEATEAVTVVRAGPADAMSRLLAGASLALAALGVLELIGMISVGLAVKTSRLSFVHRQGYAFLNQLDKSPVALLLVLGGVLGAIALLRPTTDDRSAQLATIALWAIVVASVVVGIGAVFAVLTRFRLAELSAAQKVDAVTRRVLFTFIVRNFGAAVMAAMIAVGTLFRPRPAAVVVD